MRNYFGPGGPWGSGPGGPWGPGPGPGGPWGPGPGPGGPWGPGPGGPWGPWGPWGPGPGGPFGHSHWRHSIWRYRFGFKGWGGSLGKTIKAIIIVIIVLLCIGAAINGLGLALYLISLIVPK